MAMPLPISVVIATRNRAAILGVTLESFLNQEELPQEFLIADYSDDDATSRASELLKPDFEARGSSVRYLDASHTPGAACQRNTGTAEASQPYLLYADDDILLEAGCVRSLWDCMQEGSEFGGVSSMITNQPYEQPGAISASVIKLLGGAGDARDGGRFLAGVRNVLPADSDERPAVQQVEWLNTTCTLYRTKALPSPPFPPHFGGASVCEDVALSQVVVQGGWELANHRDARIFHDSQGGDHKADQSKLIAQEFRNRAYVLRVILGKQGPADLFRLLFSQGYQALAVGMSTRSIPKLWQGIRGIFSGLLQSRLQKLPPHYSPPTCRT